MEQVKNNKERALIVGLNLDNNPEFDQSMLELMNLVEACNMKAVARIEQNLAFVNQSLYIGSGKVVEVNEVAEEVEAEVIVFNDGLTPTQLRNLQRELDAPILDRTALILEIFASRAKTREAKMQVEVARLQYLKPRLVGLGASLSRQGGGGFNNKGSGEKKIDLDRRRISDRITDLEKELDHIARERETQRKQRISSGLPRVSLVGYTNAGKSTIMNGMVEATIKEDSKKVLEMDMLFATLDTSVRKITPVDNKDFLLADTVGFVSKLPHDLIKAFRSTLEEVREADLLLHVIDYSDENYLEQQKVTLTTLKELEADEIPMIFVYNKVDLKGGEFQREDVLEEDNKIYLSAKSPIGIESLLELIGKKVYADFIECKMLLPYTDGHLVTYFKENAKVIEMEYLPEGVEIFLQCKKSDYEKYQQFSC